MWQNKRRRQEDRDDTSRLYFLRLIYFSVIYVYVTYKDGSVKGKDVVIVDDLVQTGGTLHECGLALAQAGATSVTAYAAHGA